MGLVNSFISTGALIRDAIISNAKLGTDITIGGRSYYFPIAGQTIIQGTWAGSPAPDEFYNYYYASTSANLNDEFTFKQYLSVGTYTLNIPCLAGLNYGLITVKIDGATIGTMDFYDAVGGWNFLKSITGIAITTNGLKTIDIKITGKNALSTGYDTGFTYFEFTRTA